MSPLLPQVCADVLLQHGAEGRPQVVQPAVEGVHAAAQGVAAKRAHLGEGRGQRSLTQVVTHTGQVNTGGHQDRTG